MYVKLYTNINKLLSQFCVFGELIASPTALISCRQELWFQILSITYDFISVGL